MAGGSSEAGRTVTSRALALLGAFDEQHRRQSLSDLARHATLPLSTTHRLVVELVGWGALERVDDGYVVGRRLWALGLLAPVQTELRELARPFLQDLYDVSRENAHLAVRESTYALYVERIAGRGSVPILSRPGRRLPLHATGVGKVLLAHAPDDVVEAVLADLRPVTRHTVTDRRRMRAELVQVREQGYARTAEEMTLRTHSVAAPVFDAEHDVVAAIGVVAVTGRRAMTQLVPAVQLAAAGCSRRLALRPT